MHCYASVSQASYIISAICILDFVLHLAKMVSFWRHMRMKFTVLLDHWLSQYSRVHLHSKLRNSSSPSQPRLGGKFGRKVRDTDGPVTTAKALPAGFE